MGTVTEHQLIVTAPLHLHTGPHHLSVPAAEHSIRRRRITRRRIRRTLVTALATPHMTTELLHPATALPLTILPAQEDEHSVRKKRKRTRRNHVPTIIRRQLFHF